MEDTLLGTLKLQSFTQTLGQKIIHMMNSLYKISKLSPSLSPFTQDVGKSLQ